MLDLLVRLLFEVVELGITPAKTTVPAGDGEYQSFVEPNSTTKWDNELGHLPGLVDLLTKAKEVAKKDTVLELDGLW